MSLGLAGNPYRLRSSFVSSRVSRLRAYHFSSSPARNRQIRAVAVFEMIGPVGARLANVRAGEARQRQTEGSSICAS